MAYKELKGKDYLQRFLKMQMQIDEKSAELAYWKRQENVCAVNLEMTENIKRRAEELARLILTMNEQKLFATKLIDSVSDPVGRAILRRRYILCDTWEKIAAACGNMSERNAHYIHNQALLDFEKIYCGNEAAVI